jgi:peptidoglycan-associated lipoprotein
MRVSSLHVKLMGAAAALLLVAACETPAEKAASNSAPAATAPAAPAAKKGVVPGSAEDFKVNVGDTALFDFDKSTIRADAAAVLKKQAAWLQTYPKATLTIEGHADERGTREYNIALGERRANASKEFLVSLGVNASRLSTVSYGKERPTCTSSDESCYQQNRRSLSVVQNAGS